MTHTLIRRITSLLLSLLTLLACAGLPVTAADEPEVTDRYVHDFEGAPTASDFSAESAGFGMSYVGGGTRARVVSGSDAIKGKSVRINAADMRWWSVSYTDAVMCFSIDVRADAGFRDTSLYFCATNHVGSTSTESRNGGRLIVVKPNGDGEPVLCDYNGRELAVLPRDKTVTLTAEAGYGAPTYSLFVDGECVADDCTFAGAFYAVKGLKLFAESGSADSYLVVDNIRAFTRGRAFPQKNSFQQKGDMPVVKLPEVPTVDGVAVYIDDTLVPLPALTDDGKFLLPLAETLMALGGQASVQADGAYRLETADAAYTLRGNALVWKDESVTLTAETVTADGVVYAPAQVFAEVYSVKVWYAEALGMVVLTTPARQSDNMLRNIGGSFWMNGEPYYEISFNKWDLNSQIYYDASLHGGEYINRSWCTPESTLAGAEQALRELHDNGFTSIRFFVSVVNPCRGEEALAVSIQAWDTLFDLCDKYGIRVVPCLGLTSEEFVDLQYVDGAGWVSGTENYFDFFTNPASVSRQHVYDFIDLFVGRYKDRGTVLMWEICNEGNLDADVGSGSSANYSLIQLGEFYTDMAAHIKAVDPDRLVTSGDSLIRSAQWHLLKAVMEGRERDFTVDDTDERMQALALINTGLDAVSIHGYDVGYANNGGHADYNEKSGKRVRSRVISYGFLMNEARALGLPLYNGEAGGMMTKKGDGMSAANTSAEAAEGRVRYLDSIVEAGVQLTHWWSFGSARVDFGFDMDTWNVTIDGTPETFAAIKAANEALKAKYLVNPLANENTYGLTGKTGDGAVVMEAPTDAETDTPTEPVTEPASAETVTDAAKETAPGTEADTAPAQGGCASVLPGGVLLTVCTLCFIRNKKEETLG